MKDKAEFQTSAFGIEFIDEDKTSSRDNTVLKRMVNTKIDREEGEDGQQQ